MTDQSPASLSHIEVLDILQSMKNDELNIEAKEMIREGGKVGRQDAHKKAIVALHNAFEKNFVEAVTLALGLNAGQAKKIILFSYDFRLFPDALHRIRDRYEHQHSYPLPSERFSPLSRVSGRNFV